MTDLTKEARGRECQIRLSGVCNFDPATTVFCHYRMVNITGMGFKKDSPWLGAFGCSSCHAVVDTSKDPQIQLDFCRGVFRTQAILIREGKITW